MNNQSIPHEIIFPKENLDVYFELFDDESSFVSSHWHNSLEIIYITSGNLNVKMGDQLLELYDDDIILIKCCSFYPQSEWEYRYFDPNTFTIS